MLPNQVPSLGGGGIGGGGGPDLFIQLREAAHEICRPIGTNHQDPGSGAAGPHGTQSRTASPSDSHILLYALSHGTEIIFNFPQRT